MLMAHVSNFQCTHTGRRALTNVDATDEVHLKAEFVNEVYILLSIRLRW